ncbi:non-ribosomal peptide synthetase [Paenibacillus mucilaginosus]|uniref:SrfAA n=1 Tax=Paenibacillus mucilaginosus (strain KNP414) TaxID=1036673 RepID=F8FI39_PAEMK|nr:non-ribosomal peptide synthetase [Paenibacillus mucilaginosus]AEI43381.1 SrfAA [Paenibacillus mucilaginosus KNP414]MCG7212071.1 amino acid adenylation domain-containing protein [Paenibacillus mucilaginosus]WDM24945.1 amino acid adenylation domain-containing protein [Paenibacillus mucilaginosus]
MSTTVLTEMYSLTNAQQRVWFMQQLHPDSCLMNIGLALKWRIPLQTDRLREAVLIFLRENESVRLPVMARPQEEPVRPSEYSPLDTEAVVPVLAFGEADPSGRAWEWAAREWIARDMQELLDMGSGALTRFTILELDHAQTWLYIKAHHLHADGAALIHAGREIAGIYAKLEQGSYVPSEGKPTFAEAAERERYYLASPRYEQDARFWEEQFEELSEPLFAVPELGSRTLQSGRWETVIGPGLRAQIDRFCSAAGVTPYHFFLAGAYAWLYRLTGQRDITLGSITSNRTHPADKLTYGMFANTLAVRHLLDPGSPFAEHCSGISRYYNRLLRHQKYPFNHLIAKLREQHPQLLKLYQAGIEFQVMDSGMAEGAPFDMEPLFSGMIDEELVVHVKDYRDLSTYGLTLEYKLSTFRDEEMADWGTRFVRLLESAAAEPSRTLAELPLLSGEEKRRILIGFNEAEEDLPSRSTVVGLFREQARRTPDAPAVEWGSERLSYRGLAGRSELLAQRLKGDGFETEDVVALLLPRGAELITAMLAVMTAGGAYLPVDPEYPPERIRYMLEDSGAGWLLSDEKTLQRMASNGEPALGDRVRIGTLEGMRSGMDASADSHLPEPAPESLAYVIYTSGTTGQPKGVEIEHRGLAHLIAAEGRVMGLSEATRMLQFASSSFDASVAEILPVLCYGGALVVEPREALLPGEPLLQVIRSKGVNTACLTPSVLAQLAMEPGWRESIAGLHTVVTAGEACPAEVAAAWGKGRRLINGYGPTEASVWATYQEYAADRPLHIGRPFGRSQIYLLDENMQPVPPGITGELYIGGPALARGYRNRPELTAGRFVHVDLGEPYGGTVRVYRTGDRARYAPDGCIEYCGRKDHQVKLRGHRIELEEVEAVLNAHPGVLQACVTVLEEGQGAGPALAAFIVRAGGGEQPHPEELRSWLGDKLPRHMVPHRFLEVEELPLTAGGKVDRRRLHTLVRREVATTAAAQTAAGGTTEAALTEIWIEALGCGTVTPTDPFFDLGGDSFRLLHVHRRIRERWGVSLSVTDLFRCPTIRSLARHLEGLEKHRPKTVEDREPVGPGAGRTAEVPGGNRRAELERQKRLRRKGREQ